MPLATPSFTLGCLSFDATQTIAYVRWAAENGELVSDCCGTLDDCGCWADRDTYTDPVTDAACWIPDAPTVPAVGALEFLGFQPIVVDVGSDTWSRSVMERAGSDGAVLLGARRASRSIRITGLLWASSACGMNYGERWLTQALTSECGMGGKTGCGGATMTVRICCPPVGGDPEIGLRKLHDVGLASLAIRPLVENDRCCDIVKEVEIVLVAGNPWLWPCTTKPPAFESTASGLPLRCNIKFVDAELNSSGACDGCGSRALTICDLTDPRCLNGVLA